MKKIGRHHFPETEVEADAWRPFVYHVALATRVLVVANTRIEGTWKAYIDAVPGHCHNLEIEPVRTYGSQLSEKLARRIFGDLFSGVPYAD